MYILAEQHQYGAAKISRYYCDDLVDLNDIKEPQLGDTAYIIHEKAVKMCDSHGKWYDM